MKTLKTFIYEHKTKQQKLFCETFRKSLQFFSFLDPEIAPFCRFPDPEMVPFVEP